MRCGKPRPARRVGSSLIVMTRHTRCVVTVPARRFESPRGSGRLPHSIRKQDGYGAELARAEQDVAYNVIRTYFTVVYAKMQKAVTGNVTRDLGFFHDLVEKVFDSFGGGRTSGDGSAFHSTFAHGGSRLV